MSYPLEGIRVLDMSRVLAGPFATRMLCDLGADVVKVEPPEGDTTRLWGRDIGGNPGYYHQQNVGKRNICIDLGQPRGPELVKALAARADAVVENFRPGVMARYGISYDALRQVNPALVMLSISGFGQDGPEAKRAAYAPIIHAESGLIARQAELSHAGPADLVVSMADTNAGLHGLVALLSALLMRQRTGLGQHIDMAMIDATLVTDDGLQYALEDSKDTGVLPNDFWDTAAGPILLSMDFRGIWKLFASNYGVQDPSPPGATVAEKAAMRRDAIRAFLRTLPDRESVIAVFNRLNIAWADVRSTANIRTQPTVLHRGSITDIDDRAGGTRPIVQSPYRFSNAQSGIRGLAPWKGEHNDAVLRDWLGAEGSDADYWRPALVPLE
ncbi:MAG: CoA transferase [Chloroflexi bacterium]|nr:CoA transferase [Chloroflexota bacterium]